MEKNIYKTWSLAQLEAELNWLNNKKRYIPQGTSLLFATLMKINKIKAEIKTRTLFA